MYVCMCVCVCVLLKNSEFQVNSFLSLAFFLSLTHTERNSL